MANSDIIRRMNVVLSQVEGGEVLATQAEQLLEQSIAAIEGIDSRVIDDCRDLTHRLTIASFHDANDELHLSEETKEDVLASFRAFLSSLPDI